MHWSVLICSVAFLLSACRPALEKKLVGQWVFCSIDICTVTALNADRTFSQQFDEKDTPGDICSGSWRVDHAQLVLHVTHADKVLQDVLGKDVRFIISEVDGKKFVATPAEDKTKPLTWERRH
jgi:hypothetical protein